MGRMSFKSLERIFSLLALKKKFDILRLVVSRSREATAANVPKMQPL